MKTPTDWSSYARIFKKASTPSWQEFSQVAKIAGAGILFVGFVGFLIFTIMFFIKNVGGIA